MAKGSSLAKLPEISFQKGLNTLQKNRLLLSEGESASLVNANFDEFGGIGILYPFASVKALSGRVHSIFKTGTHIFVGHGTSLSRLVYPGYAATEVITGLSGLDLSMFATENFLYVTNGTDRKKIYLPTLAVTNWGFDAPLAGPSAAVGAAGLPTGLYDLYYTYVAKYPDGTEYETDLSPMAQIEVSLAKIEWTYPATAPDAQISHIRLYREKTGLVGNLTDMRKAIETRQETLEQATNKKLFSRIVQDAIRRATTKQMTQQMTNQDAILGPFEVGEVSVGDVGFSDNISDGALVQKIPHLRERYKPIFGV